MKGQFMLMSAIVIGLILISTANLISETNSQSIEGSETAYLLKNIREEANNADLTSPPERRSLIRMIEDMDKFEAEVVYWDNPSKECLNVTLNGHQERYELNCIN